MADAVSLLERISSFVGDNPEGLAVTVAARSGDPYAVLVSTILSLRTRDETVHVVAPRVLKSAPTPKAMAELSEPAIAELIYPTSFHRLKAGHLKSMCLDIVEKHGGKVPDTLDGLMALKGVGRKSANLVLNLAFSKTAICVDIHVHRVSNRLGLVRTDSPEGTERGLTAILPESWWIPVNGVLIAFGRTHCTPVSPKCSTCPVRNDCPKAGVQKSR